MTTGETASGTFKVTEPGNVVDRRPRDSGEGRRTAPPDDVVAAGPRSRVKVGNVVYRATPPRITVRARGLRRQRPARSTSSSRASVNGLRLGLLLALASVGLSLIYGTTGLSNFAHAEQVTLGGMLGYFLINVHGIGLWIGGLLVVILCGFTGWFQDRVMWQPLRRRGLGLTQMMIVTIGLSLALQYTYQYSSAPAPSASSQDNPKVHDVRLGHDHQPVPGRDGDRRRRARASSATPCYGPASAGPLARCPTTRRCAQASGIDTDKVIRLVWTMSMALAGLSGLLYALVVNGIKWDTGLQILLLLLRGGDAGWPRHGVRRARRLTDHRAGRRALAAVRHPGDFKYATALFILILLLLVRPQGLLGQAQRVG